MDQEKQGVEPSGPKAGGEASESKQGEEQKEKAGHINPSAPEDSNTTPGTTGEK